MDTFNHIVGGLLGGYFALFGGAPPLLSLALLSALAGVGMLWIFRITSDQASIRAAKRRLQAHLLELRLFGDEPALMWRAQKDLLLANLRYMGLMLRPALWIALPMIILLVHLDAYYGRAPLPVGREAIVTVGMRGPIDVQAPPPRLEAPASIAVETPGVRILEDRQIAWRIRPQRPMSGALRLVLAGEAVEKRIEAGPGFRFVPGRRASSPVSLFWYPDEPRLPSGGIEWIDVRYPAAEPKLLGIRLHWLIWFTLISMLSALLLKKKFRVTL